MTEEERRNMFENFLRNGMDISPFGFREEYDKENFFTMIEEYLTAMSDKVVSITYNYKRDMAVHIDDRLICIYMISPDYRTLTLDTDLDLDDKDLIMCITMLFLTVKELNSMIDSLTKLYADIHAKHSSRKYESSDSNRKFIPTSNLPKNIQNNINKIKKLQKSILSENQKYKISRKKIDKEDE